MSASPPDALLYAADIMDGKLVVALTEAEALSSAKLEELGVERESS